MARLTFKPWATPGAAAALAASLALSGCLNTDLSEFNVTGAGLGVVLGPGQFSFQGLTHPSFLNASTAATFQVGGACADEGRGLLVTLVSGGGTLPDQSTNCAGGTWSVGASYLSLTDGPLLLRARWSDEPTDPGQDLPLTKDTVAPVASLMYPLGGELLAGGVTASIQWSASDAGGIPARGVRIERANGGAWSAIHTGTDNTGSFDWTVPMLNDTDFEVRILVSDQAGNTSISQSPGMFTIDSLAPSATLQQAPAQLDPTNSLSADFDLVFSEPITPATLTPSDIQQLGSAPGVTWTITNLGDGINFTLHADAASGPGTLRPFLPPGAVSDASGNLNAGSTGADGTVTYDTVAPTISLNQAGGQADPTNSFPVIFDLVFSEPINPGTFDASDITQTGSATGVVWTLSNTGDDRNFTLSATGVATSGTLIPSVLASVVSDLAGNGNMSSASTDNIVLFDDLAPSVSLEQDGGQLDPESVLPIAFTVAFSEPINPGTFVPADVTQTGTATSVVWSVTNTGDDTVFTLRAIAVGTNGTLIPVLNPGRVSDPAGNGNTVSSSVDGSVTYDTIGPSVTVNQAGGQLDPINTLPIVFTVVFSEPVNPTTFTSADLNNAGTASGITWSFASGDSQIWTISATAISSPGTLILGINSGTVQDPAGNSNAAGTSSDAMVTYDTTAPTVTIAQEGGQPDPTNALPINFTATFSEPINPASFTDIDIAEAGSADSLSWSIIHVSGQQIFTLRATGVGTQGGVVPTISAGMVTDPAGNPNTASSATDNSVEYDILAPSGLNLQLNGGAAETSGPALTVIAYSGDDASAERYVTFTPGCGSGGTWAPANATPFGMDLNTHLPGVYYVYARFRDPAGNLTSCISTSITMDVLLVEPVYGASPARWESYVRVNAPGSPIDQQPGTLCTGTETGKDPCVHSGGMFRVVTEEPSCAGLSMLDSEDAFIWRCEMRGGFATFLSSGFKHGKGLGHLIRSDRTGFKDLGVQLFGGALSATNSVPYRLWNNPVVPLDPSALSFPFNVYTLDATPGAGTIWALPDTVEVGGGFNLDADGISLTMLPGGSYGFDSLDSSNCASGTGDIAGANVRCVLAAGANKFLWIEGNFHAGVSLPHFGLLLQQAAQTRVQRFQYVGPSDAAVTRTGIQVNNTLSSNRGAILSDVQISRVRGSGSYGINLAGYGVILENASVSDTFYGIFAYAMDGADPMRLHQVRVSNANLGVNLQNPGNVLTGGTITHTNNAVTVNNGTSSRVAMTTTGRVSAFANNYIVNGSSTNTVLHQLVSYGPVRGLSIEGAANNTTLSDSAFARMGTGQILQKLGGTAGSLKLTGNLLLSDTSCGDSSGSPFAEFTASCAPAGVSDHTVHSLSLRLANSFYGPLGGADDDFAFEGIDSPYNLLTDWFDLANPFRAFGSTQTSHGMCATGETCGIYDWRLLSADTELLNRGVDPTSPEPPLLDGAACPVDGSATLSDISASTTYLRAAVEIPFDFKGNDNGLCESDEACLYTPNYGSYQGTGDLYANRCAFTDGFLANIALYGYPMNGVAGPLDASTSPPPGLGASRP
ncbi:MAG: hypothetical protein IT285_09500 [Bdellovibrionales bacterium]|nr:hypothetical protein [Bdellovibrionales bacterium]